VKSKNTRSSGKTLGVAPLERTIFFSRTLLSHGLRFTLLQRPSHCCSWLHRFELLRQAQARDGNSGH